MAKTYKTGDPCWCDLVTPELEKAKDFYGQLFGWTFGETREDLGGYTQIYKNGLPVAGVLHFTPNMNNPAWSLYFSSSDISKTSELIAENGGTIVSPAMAVEDLGSMLIATDPTGAVFGIWQAGSFQGAQLTNDSGSLSWEDLRTDNPVAAREFYTSVFGYRHDDMPVDGVDFKTFAHSDGEAPLGGIGEMMGAPLPPHWIPYFRVDDTPAALEIVKSQGGTVASPSVDTPFGRQAIIIDPWGASLSIIDSEGAQ